MKNEQTVHEETAWVHSLAEALDLTHREYIQKKVKRPSSRASNWASQLGHPCELQQTFWRTQGEKAQEVDGRLQGIFEEGKKQENLIVRELEDMGVQVMERGVAIGNGSDSMLRGLNIHGYLDAKLDISGLPLTALAALSQACPDVDWRRRRVVAECKSLSPYLFDSLHDYDDFMTHKRHYVRSWAEQMQIYLLGHNDEGGLFVLKNKVTGQLRFIPVLLDLETCEALAQKASRINTAVERYQKDGSLPEPIKWRQDICPECPFLAICPNSREIPETEISTDQELIEALERREELKPYLAEDRELKSNIDHRLEQFEGKDVLVGDYQIRWNKIERKEKITPASTYFMKRITKIPN